VFFKNGVPVKTNPWSALQQIWLSVGLPGFHSETTYQGYQLEKMPAIPIKLDDDLMWLYINGTPRPGNGLDGRDEFAKPLPPATVVNLAKELNLPLPASFSQFMTSPDLQSRVRSCTDCYLDPGERIVETIGSIPGYLMHFLSDSQSCAHWYLHVLPDGRSAVLQSADLYCYEVENSDWMENPACRQERIDLTMIEAYFCASSFSEFLFRFWIENEIWYVVRDYERRPLTALENAYLENRVIRVGKN
jgi:hypothetical protein